MNIRTMRIGDYDEVYALWMSCAGMGLNNTGFYGAGGFGIEKQIHKRNDKN